MAIHCCSIPAWSLLRLKAEILEERMRSEIQMASPSFFPVPGIVSEPIIPRRRMFPQAGRCIAAAWSLNIALISLICSSLKCKNSITLGVSLAEFLLSDLRGSIVDDLHRSSGRWSCIQNYEENAPNTNTKNQPLAFKCPGFQLLEADICLPLRWSRSTCRPTDTCKAHLKTEHLNTFQFIV